MFEAQIIQYFAKRKNSRQEIKINTNLNYIFKTTKLYKKFKLAPSRPATTVFLVVRMLYSKYDFNRVFLN